MTPFVAAVVIFVMTSRVFIAGSTLLVAIVGKSLVVMTVMESGFALFGLC